MQPITILLEHSDFLIIDKPAGIPVQNEPGCEGILPRVCRQQGRDKLWLVHRLDKVTSGALILAKHSTAAASFGELFATRQIHKCYLALSDKKPGKKQGRIAGDMKKVRSGQYMLQKTLNSPAVTQFISYGTQAGIRLFLLKPVTGKTHQLRVMMKSLGSAILGDELYKGTCADRTYLHAFAVSFNYQGQPYSVLSPATFGEHFAQPEINKLITELNDPWHIAWPILPTGLQKSMGKDPHTDE